MTWLIGDYRYGGCVIDDVQYAVIKNHEVVERIRVMQPEGNPVIWQKGDTIDDRIVSIMAQANFEQPAI